LAAGRRRRRPPRRQGSIILEAGHSDQVTGDPVANLEGNVAGVKRAAGARQELENERLLLL
jgi:hypothetical protein